MVPLWERALVQCSKVRGSIRARSGGGESEVDLDGSFEGLRWPSG